MVTEETLRPAPPAGLRMEDVQRLVGELYLEIVFLRLELQRLRRTSDGDRPAPP